ncbi:glutathione synthetase-like [Lytechinus variegatus]|uniref:glutathione synthetase-like n=1 Tax=Lytechinus variegatus TaxID=7654 RepID=UPI001BB185FE|nr:glutathione synthetase-like [Lytechinus variegatus]XP_041454305.1 glutathione synthetase-like [Lytechinus variegatus]
MVELHPAVELPLSTDELEELAEDMKDRAYAMGVLIRPSKHRTIHGPITLLPSTFPRLLYNKAMQLQTDINLLMLGISKDDEFLYAALKSVVPVDEFTRRLYEMHLQVKKEGCFKPVTLCINRTDYMLDCCKEDDEESFLDLSMVEINTIAAGCPALSTRLVDVHRFSLEQLGMSREKVLDRVPGNYGMEGVADGMVTTWRLYGETKAVLVFVVRPEESNKFDQRWMEYGIKDLDDRVKVIRRTLPEIGERAELRGDERRLFIDGMEVAILYFRTGYSPIDYPTEMEWNARLLGERSRAAVCPSVAMQLAGTKKIQQVLYDPGSIELFLKGKQRVDDVRSIFTGHYTLDLTPAGDEAAERAIANPMKYVMKPQREGGGNNLFGEKMKEALEKLRGSPERAAYMLMDRFNSPVNHNYCMKCGSSDLELMTVASEFGPFGTLVSYNNEVVFNKTTGYLYRTKDIKLDEGGLMVGTGFLDTPYLSSAEVICPSATQNGFGEH